MTLVLTPPSPEMDFCIFSTLMASLSVLGGILGVFLIHKLPRVKLSMVMMSLMSVSMTVLGSVLYLKTSSPSPPSPPSPLLDIVAVISVTAFMFCFSAGVGPLSSGNGPFNSIM